ncbi:MAG: prepilin-type N-terminal cleavage/methylation domain-containing protein [Candidatus Hydrogenedentes bacterium]|nr:prepilin-type N-terminal cleavage/methylation domain-containing protein [Candidatus Hydrogenedentota bacterium]
MNANRHSGRGLPRTARRRAHTALAGVTLTELIVVMAIISLLAAVAVPTLIRMGALSRRELVDSARPVFGLLRAARTYSATYRVDTAVVYTQLDVVDSRTGLVVRVIDGLGTAWKLRDEHMKAPPFDAIPSGERDAAYVMIQAPEGRFRKLPTNTCVENEVFEVDGDGTSMNGLVEIVLYDPSGNQITPRSDYGTQLDDAFPAHVFCPSGLMKPEDSTYARFEITVGPSPAAPIEERFSQPPADDIEAAAYRRPPVRIDVFQTTGRTRMEAS